MKQTLAEKAVFHIVRRVQSDVDFAWLMMGTESLALCFAAIADARGETEEAVRQRIEANAATTRETPEIVTLRLQAVGLQRTETDAAVAADRDTGLRCALQDLLWQSQCGADVLTVENLTALLEGRVPCA